MEFECEYMKKGGICLGHDLFSSCLKFDGKGIQIHKCEYLTVKKG